MSGGWWDDDDPQQEEESGETGFAGETGPEAEPAFPEWPVYESLNRPPAADEPQRDLLAAGVAEERFPERRPRDPLARLFPGLPRNVRVTLDWILTIAGAVAIVVLLKLFVVNPYRIPSSSMEPTLKCAKPGPGCTGNSSDRVLACRICLDVSSPSRGDIIVFSTPRKAALECGEGGTFVKRLIGLPGEEVKEDATGFIWIRAPGSHVWQKLNEPYISTAQHQRDAQMHPEFHNKVWPVPKGQYFFMGDNRSESCDSRSWGSVPRDKLIGTVFFVYWPPDRIGFR